MSRNNRQRRAAKAKGRAGRARSTGRRETGRAVSPPVAADEQTFADFTVDDQQQAFDDQLGERVHQLIACGWNPDDLREIARRRVTRTLGQHLLGVVAELTARHSDVDSEWLAQLDGVRPEASCARWAMRHRLAWPAALEQLVELLVALESLPRIEEVVPRPGAPRRVRSQAHGVDERVLRKVRSLLAKAESTEFDDEADALTAKAQELMTRHSIERALADGDEPAPDVPSVRRLWLEAPYVEAKAMLVNEIAAGNRVRCVLTGALGFVTLVGFSVDLDAVELLTTSLLVQATRALRVSGSQVSRHGASRTRSFRRSFLVSFAVRIGERLRGAAARTEADADTARGGALVPVLTARELAVGEATDALFPALVSRRVNVHNPAGWVAGRVAADLASLDVRSAIERAG